MPASYGKILKLLVDFHNQSPTYDDKKNNHRYKKFGRWLSGVQPHTKDNTRHVNRLYSQTFRYQTRYLAKPLEMKGEFKINEYDNEEEAMVIVCGVFFTEKNNKTKRIGVGYRSGDSTNWGSTCYIMIRRFTVIFMYLGFLSVFPSPCFLIGYIPHSTSCILVSPWGLRWGGRTPHTGRVNSTCWISPIWSRRGPDVLLSRRDPSWHTIPSRNISSYYLWSHHHNPVVFKIVGRGRLGQKSV